MKFRIEQAVEVLRRTPPSLREMLQGLPDEWLFADEGNGTWSVYDVVGHLIHGEKTDWIPRARSIVEYGEERTFEPFDRTAMLATDRSRPLDQMLGEFAELRAGNLKELEKLGIAEDIVQRSGRHPDLGTVTLGQLLATWVVHDLGHTAQIARVMAKQYKEAVGPWTAYLSIITR